MDPLFNVLLVFQLLAMDFFHLFQHRALCQAKHLIKHLVICPAGFLHHFCDQIPLFKCIGLL